MSDVYLVTIKAVENDTATTRITVFDFHENIPL